MAPAPVAVARPFAHGFSEQARELLLKLQECESPIDITHYFPQAHIWEYKCEGDPEGAHSQRLVIRLHPNLCIVFQQAVFRDGRYSCQADVHWLNPDARTYMDIATSDNDNETLLPREGWEFVPNVPDTMVLIPRSWVDTLFDFKYLDDFPLPLAHDNELIWDCQWNDE